MDVAYALARAVRLVVGVVALIIVVGGILFVLSANPTNAIVHDIHDAAGTLVGPFGNVFSISGHPEETLVANWGLAVVIYLIVGGIIAMLIARMGPRTMVRPRTFCERLSSSCMKAAFAGYHDRNAFSGDRPHRLCRAFHSLAAAWRPNRA
jgi:hypothetical protein